MSISKTHFVGLIVAVLLMSVVLNAYAVYRVVDLARQGAEVHAAECLHVSELHRQIQNGEAFLHSTPAERKAKYGPLAKVPVATIRQSVVQEKAAFASYAPLRCDG